MKQLLTATCFAMACAVGLAAQQTTGTTGTSGTTADQAGQGRGGPRTVTGCLRAGDTAGTYMLTDIKMGEPSGTTGTTSGTSTTSGSTTSSGTSGTSAEGGQRGQMPTSLMLNPESSVDLKAHVGHKIEVTGTMAGGGRRGGDTTASTSGSTSGGTMTGGSTATSGQETTGGGQRSMRAMNVTAVRMVSESCSQ